MWNLGDYYENSHTPLNSLRKTRSVMRQTDWQKWSKPRKDWGRARANGEPTNPIRVYAQPMQAGHRLQLHTLQGHCMACAVWQGLGSCKQDPAPSLYPVWTSPPLEDLPASSCKQTPAPLHLTGNTKGIKSEAGSRAGGLLFTLNMPFSFCPFFIIINFFVNNDGIFRTGDTSK